MATSIQVTKWSWLTGVVNEMKRPNSFLKDLLFADHESVSTEDIEMSLLSKGRETAPFVRKNGEAIQVSGHSETFQMVSAPNIRIKRPFSPSNLLFNRRAGTGIHINRQSQGRAIRQHVGRDLRVMEDMVTNSEELLCALALQGTISYEVEDQEVFDITFNRAASTKITLASGRAWDNADPTLPRPLQDVHAVKRVMSDEVDLQPTDAICGLNAASAILELAESGNLPAFKKDSGVSAGTITFVSQFTDTGAIFLGEMGGVRFWEYSRTVGHNGSSTSMIRSDYVEFVSRSRASQRVLYYGAIPDVDAMQSFEPFVGERFAKSWVTKDPSQLIALLASRPLPVPRRPNATVSVQVTNV